MNLSTGDANSIGNWRLFLCDEVVPGQFGKLNLVGYNPTRSIFIDQPNYILQSTFLLEGVVGRESIGRQVQVELGIQWEGDYKPITTRETPHILSDTGVDPQGIEIVIPFEVLLPGICRLTANFYVDDQLVLSEAHEVSYGEAPNFIVRAGQRLPNSRLLGPGAGIFDVSDLIQAASKEVVIIDQYLPPNELLALLQNAAEKNIRVLVLTGFGQLATYKKATTQLRSSGFEDLIIKFSSEFHDRFLIVNGTEMYAFGYSLKDLSGKRFSRYSKVINKDEFDQTPRALKTVWEQATPLSP